MRRIIFVGGIHGVGKTFICNEIATEFHIAHYSASNLIAKERDEQFSSYKRISNINDNQNVLIKALHKFTFDNQWILLDGHFCLLNKEGSITKVPKETFHEIAPLGVIVLKDSVENIASKLNTRDGINYNSDFLNSFQKAELDYCKTISYELKIPYNVYCVGDSKTSLYDFIDRLQNP